MTDEEYIIKLGSILLDLRKEKAFSQQELSFRTGIEKPYIRKIEKGRTNPTIKTLLKLSLALDTTLHKIFEKISN
jgi:transcriptional regulator with XRE-family HTH domain